MDPTLRPIQKGPQGRGTAAARPACPAGKTNAIQPHSVCAPRLLHTAQAVS